MKRLFLFLLILVLAGCNQPSRDPVVLQNRIDSLEKQLTARNSEFILQSILWFEHSPEMTALYIQSYNMAKKTLAENLRHKKYKGKKNAVVVDIDETLLDNSPYEGWLYLANSSYSDSSWNSWVKTSAAEPLPGALDFLNYAKKSGCEVFYVSNRKADPLLDATLENLKHFRFPFADEGHLLLKTSGDTTRQGKSSKEKRRLKIENELNFEILLLCGDQMADFDKAFDIQKDGTGKQIRDSVEKYRENFSTRFIVLPNPVYSDWLGQIVYGRNKNHSFAHSDSLRRSKVISWKVK